MRLTIVTILAAGAFVLPALAQAQKPDDPRATELKAKLDRIIIPAVEFEAVGLREAMKVLRRRSQELDPDGEGVNFVVHTGDENPKVTLHLRDVSFAALVRMLTTLTDTEYEFDENIIVIRSATSRKKDKGRSGPAVPPDAKPCR